VPDNEAVIWKKVRVVNLREKQMPVRYLIPGHPRKRSEEILDTLAALRARQEAISAVLANPRQRRI